MCTVRRHRVSATDQVVAHIKTDADQGRIRRCEESVKLVRCLDVGAGMRMEGEAMTKLSSFASERREESRERLDAWLGQARDVTTISPSRERDPVRRQGQCRHQYLTIGVMQIGQLRPPHSERRLRWSVGSALEHGVHLRDPEIARGQRAI